MLLIAHWQFFVLLYLAFVSTPVYCTHVFLKKRAYANSNFGNLILYFVGVLGTGFVMHCICMWLYFTFFF